MLTRPRVASLLCAAFLALLPLSLFWSVTLGDRTLLPADNLFQWEPFRSSAGAFGLDRPQNHLLSDLILQNYAWKQFALQSLGQGELPLWNPNLFAGAPFLAAGQHSALYPLSILYAVLPLDKAYGWFTVVNLALAGLFMFVFMRTLGVRRAGATFAGVAWQFSGFLVVSTVFPMIVAAAAWLPLILAMAERVIRQAPALGGRPASAPWAIIGAAAVGMSLLAGHVEIMVYTALIAAAYCAWRLATAWFADRRPSLILRRAGWLAVMAVLGAALAAVQILPLLELVQTSFRAARSSFADVLSYGFPFRHVLLWLMPNFYGSPAQHTTFDLFAWQSLPVGTLSGHTEWGIKNYVEGACYVGILTLVFAGAACAGEVRRLFRRPAGSAPSDGGEIAAPTRPPAWFFIVLGLFSLAFIFGTPLYALLYYGLPGINQLNSPFRWVFALTLSLCALASFGLDALIAAAEAADRPGSSASRRASRPKIDAVRLAAAALIGLGGLILAGLAAARLAWPAFEPLVDRVYLGMARANEGYTSAAMFFSHQALNAVVLALAMIGSGVLLALARRSAARPAWGAAAVLLLAVDLHLAWVGFNPSVDPRLLDHTPPAAEYLQQDKGLWRLTSYDPGGQKTLNANIPWLFGLQDIRGYDSIIPKPYTDYMSLIEPQDELMYNRIAPLSELRSLDSPLLDLLGVKYVVTTATIDLPSYTLVYDETGRGGATRIYRNERAMPRAFTLPVTSSLLTADFASAVQQKDPRRYAMIDASCGITDTGCVIPYPADPGPATVTSYRNNEVWIDAQVSQPSWLILADSYFPGWKAFVRPLGGRDDEEREVPIVRANGNFRAVRLGNGDSRLEIGDSRLEIQSQSPISNPQSLIPNLQSPASAPAAAYTIRFRYSPTAFQAGAFATFIGLMALLVMSGVYLWRYVYRESMASSPVRRVAKNSLVLTGFNIGARLIDFAFAMLMARVLGPDGVGNYYFAVVIVGWFEILMNFGLNTYLTREVARDPSRANKYLYNTSVLRLLLSLGTAPLVAAVILAWNGTVGLTRDTAIAIILLAAAQVPSSLSTGLSALFFAHEKAEVPASLSIVSALIKVSLGAAALLGGLGIVGLAATSIVVNLVTLAILLATASRSFFVPRREGDGRLRRGMLRESFPLMINHLLATLFFKIDVPLLQGLQSSTAVGWYSVAYKFIDAYNIIPAFFTQSFFPVMSRQAGQAGGALARSYALSLKLLVMIALPLAVATAFAAPLLVGVLGGAEFLPAGAVALAVMVWSMPFGWINSVTNYALIAVDQQRALTRAFLVGLAFNVAANLILIPRFSYLAAAVVTIFSEIVEGAAFYVYVRRHIGPVRWAGVLGRPVLAAGVMILVTWIWASGGAAGVGLLYGSLAYAATLWLAGALAPDEAAMLAPLLPARLRKAPPAPQVGGA